MAKTDTLCIASCGKTKIWSKQPDAGPTKTEHDGGCISKDCGTVKARMEGIATQESYDKKEE